ncbi:helix-turn-helix domain-containing protein [Paraburkholderia azotifigens]|uniref:Helix-turn-helix transcriptional regulator n=1 Tax=Paraburkholderia azotifigens TaxID=2057004 RepID=A0A5C6V7X5_9BURK|nr:helix-turn-helix transcriptional regulator [Paraburkholderia azotifigens]TXC81137.1 helix-turn-helix transcriptional regulator [Paraburkholderia azotifigens]
MNRNAHTIEHLERCRENGRVRRALAARLNTACRRAGVSSARVAKSAGVSERDVKFWRRGITSPTPQALKRIAAVIDVDFYWLCTGQDATVASRSYAGHHFDGATRRYDNDVSYRTRKADIAARRLTA